MSGLFGPKVPPPEEPATMPDEKDAKSRRTRRKMGVKSGAQSTRYTEGATVSGKEYTRGTLG